MYFETHAHYDDEKFDTDRHELLTELRKSVQYVINCGANMSSSEQSVRLASEYDFIYAAVGVHPHYANEIDIAKLKTLTQFEKVIAIGEIGLDYHYDNSPRDLQRDVFKQQMLLANELSLPIIIHSRDASNETFEMVKQFSKVKGVVHCFSDSLELAMEYIKLGMYIGIGGVVTFSNAKRLVETVRQLPIDKIMIETDCPYLSPIRGERNDSRNLKLIVEKIAEIKNISHDEVVAITTRSACKLFFGEK